MKILFASIFFILITSCNSETAETNSTNASNNVSENTNVLNAEEIMVSDAESFGGGNNIYDDKYQIGRGFNSSTNEVLAPVVIYKDHTDLTTVSQQQGSQTIVDLKRITNYDELKSFMELNLSGNAKFGWFKASVKVQKFKEIKWNSFSDFLVAKVVVYNPSKILKKSYIDTEPLSRLKNNINDFYDFYGDEFIAGIKEGGELYVLYQFNNFNSEDKTSTSAAINLAISSFVGSAKSAVNLKESLSTLSAKKDMSVNIIRLGDNEKVDLKDADVLLNYVEKFPSIVNSKQDKAALVYVFTNDIFSTNNFPPGIPKSSKNKVISQGEKLNEIYKRLEAIELANNDLNFIKNNKTKFNLTEIMTLEEDLEHNIALQEKLEQCATRCFNSIDGCESCKETLAIKIKKITPSSIGNIPTETQFTLSVTDKIIPNSNNYIEVCRIPSGKQAKIEFKGKLLSPTGCFDPFISAYNNDISKDWKFGRMVHKNAYPVIEIQIINTDGVKTETLRYSDRVKIINSENGETIVKAGLKVYSYGINQTFPFGTYLTPCDPSNVPRADIYLRSL